MTTEPGGGCGGFSAGGGWNGGSVGFGGGTGDGSAWEKLGFGAPADVCVGDLLDFGFTLYLDK